MDRLKDIVALALYPLGLLWGALIVAAIVAWHKRQRRIAVFLAALAIFLSLCGTPLPALLLASLEKPYRAATVAAAHPTDAVVMLGGITARSASDPMGFRLASSSRFIAAIEIVRTKKAGVLIIGGGQKYGDAKISPEAEFLARLATNWGLVQCEIIALPNSRDTSEEAARVKTLLSERKWTNLTLVTSAFHMRRAEAVFARRGLHPQLVACDFAGQSALERHGLTFTVVPTSQNLKMLEQYLHETVGLLYYRVRGWL